MTVNRTATIIYRTRMGTLAGITAPCTVDRAKA